MRPALARSLWSAANRGVVPVAARSMRAAAVAQHVVLQRGLSCVPTTRASEASVFRSPFSDMTIPETNLWSFISQRWTADPEVAARPAFIPQNLSPSGLTQSWLLVNMDGHSNADDGQVFTFAQMHNRVEGAASGLAALGFGVGDVLSIHMPNHPDFYTALLAAVKLGGTVTTSNPVYTSRELHHQLTDSEARFALTTEELSPVVQQAAVDSSVEEVFVLGTTANWLDHAAEGTPTAPVDAKEHLAVLPYSSGTTGLPKGVMLSHYNIISNVCQYADCEGLCDWREDTKVLGVLPFFHIYGLVIVSMCPLYRGCTVVTMSKFEPVAFLETMQTYRISIAYLVPPIILFLTKHPLVAKYDLGALRDIFSGAAPLDAEVQKECSELFNGHVVVRQGYGMTELSPVSHASPLVGQKYGTSGLLLPNTECKVVDAEGKALSANETGELCIKGPQVMVGYLNRPDATAETIDADGWLHTGDIATVDDDGFVTVVDRIKELIKVKGLQVAPAELEGLLLNDPRVADCAVIGVPDERAGEVPKAFVQRQSGHDDLTAEDVMRDVNKNVAEFKHIKSVEFLDAIPKSPSGKILRRLLRDMQ